jgi:hypothetical protein
MINNLIFWLSRSETNLYSGVLVAGVAWLLLDYTIGLSRYRRNSMSLFGHLINIIIAPVIGSIIALLIMQGYEYLASKTFYTAYFVRNHSQGLLHSLQFGPWS